MSPIAAALAAQGIAPLIVLTGQHPELDLVDFGLADFACRALHCAGQRNPHAHAEMVRRAMRASFAPKPEIVVVQGDTSSAFGAAQAAFFDDIPVAHVEAGLRTHDPSAPWPEEEYRTAIDARAALLFAPTDGAAEHLEREKVAGAVFVTGNSGVDATLAIEAALPPLAVREHGRPRLLVTCHRRESWGPGLDGIAAAVRALAMRGNDIRFVLHPNPHVAAAMRRLLGGRDGVTLLEPFTHAELLQEMRNADLVLSDSGGIQEEAPVLGVPMLVLREKTERPEGIAQGHALLVGVEPERIIAEASRLLDDPVTLAGMSRRGMPYGDGRASGRIAALIVAWLERRRMSA
jgi:UDP-N-acetylglucosamine 2-epimerase (non-hydrolysing)